MIGIVPSDDPAQGNPHCTHVVATGIGHARNLAVVASGAAVIAIGGEWGTLSEIAFGRAARADGGRRSAAGVRRERGRWPMPRGWRRRATQLRRCGSLSRGRGLAAAFRDHDQLIRVDRGLSVQRRELLQREPEGGSGRAS